MEQLTFLAEACTSAFQSGIVPQHELIGEEMHKPLQWLSTLCSQDIVFEGCTLNTLFDLIRSQHWHCHGQGNIVEPKRDQSPITCCFHHESLWEHSCGVMVVALKHALKLGYPPDICRLAALTGLLHDIGKIMTVTILRKKSITFPMHCCVGAGAILQWKLDIPSNHQEALARTIAVHMCGYFREDWESPSSETLWRLKLFQGESFLTKQLLCALRPSDMSASIADAGKEESPWGSQIAFENAIMKTNGFNLAEFKKLCNLQGTVILINSEDECENVKLGDTNLKQCLLNQDCVVSTQVIPGKNTLVVGDIVYRTKMKDALDAKVKGAFIVAIDIVPNVGGDLFGLDWLPKHCMGHADGRVALQFFLRPRAAHARDPVNSFAPHLRIQVTPDKKETLSHWLPFLFEDDDIPIQKLCLENE